MISSILLPWQQFFSTVAEAAATLTGLVIVAVSVNLQKIIAFKHLPARAFGAIGALTALMVSCVLALIPQPVQAYAVELGGAAVVGWYLHLRTARTIFEGHAELGRPLYERVLMLAFGQVQLLPLSLGAICLGLGHPWGLYFISGTAIAALIVAVINAWVLLVEIVR